MREKILVVEDDPAALRLVSFTLESAGYKVIPAVNGIEGLRKAQEEAPDLLVLDLMLPGIDGYEVCHRLRSDPAGRERRLPILMLTAKSQETDRAMAEKMGVDLYLSKPVTPEEITAAVHSLLSQRQEEHA
jgi:two-component system, OmpR family, alkaline phosphatase synthesis response regulator PhoP